jgi:hypothetical protein
MNSSTDDAAFWEDERRRRGDEKEREELTRLATELFQEEQGIRDALDKFNEANRPYWHFRHSLPFDFAGKTVEQMLSDIVDTGIEVCKQLRDANRSAAYRGYWTRRGAICAQPDAGRESRLDFKIPSPSPEYQQAIRFWVLCQTRDRDAALAHIKYMEDNLSRSAKGAVWQAISDLSRRFSEWTEGHGPLLGVPTQKPPPPKETPKETPPGDDRKLGKKKRKGGRKPLEQSNPLKFQVYQRIQREHKPGEDYADVVTRLKMDKNFMEQVQQARLKLTRSLWRAALAFFQQPARKKQETDPA